MNKNGTVLEFFISKFEGETINEFISNIDEHIQENYDLIEEWIEQGVDEKSIECQEDYIRDIMSKHKLYKGIMTYDEVVQFKKFCEKKGESCEHIFYYIQINKSNLEALKSMVWKDGLGYSDEATFEEEKVREEKMLEAFEEIKTITDFRKFLKEFEVCEYYGFVNYKKHLVSFI